MPKATPVERCYNKLVKQGKAKGSAAAICQSSTGKALATGRKPKGGRSMKGRKTRLIPKEDHAVALGHSPDLADALIQSFAFD